MMMIMIVVEWRAFRTVLMRGFRFLLLTAATVLMRRRRAGIEMSPGRTHSQTGQQADQKENIQSAKH